MSSKYTKLFGDIITSSIWSEDDYTRLLWITMLASSDWYGNVSGTIPGMAAIARMSIKNTTESIKKLCAPDPYSRSKSHGGRRLVENENGWHIVNYVKYREKYDPEKRKEQNRASQKRYREAKKADSKQIVINSNQEVIKSNQPSAHIDKDIDKDKDKGNKRRTPNNGEFDSFWELYPNKKGKGAARKVFGRISPDAQLFKKIIAAVEQQKSSEQWKRDGGQYIPHPATWLNQERWDDEVEHKETVGEQLNRLHAKGELK